MFFFIYSGKVKCLCDNCGKILHLKRSHFLRSVHHYCCPKCHYEHKKVTFCGENNHQYGLRGSANASFIKGDLTAKNNDLTEVKIFVGEWYQRFNEHGRIKLHRYLVEKNYFMFNPCYFECVDDWHYLKPDIEVHHIDFDHSNNDISNLIPLTKSEHRRLHNSHRKQNRDKITGRFIKK